VLPVFWAKADAKVLQIFDMTKYFSKKNASKMHFLCKSLKINNHYFGHF